MIGAIWLKAVNGILILVCIKSMVYLFQVILLFSDTAALILKTQYLIKQKPCLSIARYIFKMD
ncbi:MAG: hypothetical protein B6I20_00010 [Bacteroidetes bacterium 4572_117]|nr:MAG: hypothetical protein B6I20_00010 [Bacteroidetes bacterium 4572_117]